MNSSIVAPLWLSAFGRRSHLTCDRPGAGMFAEHWPVLVPCGLPAVGDEVRRSGPRWDEQHLDEFRGDRPA